MSQCTIDGCTALVRARGYCSAHYQRWRKYGDPIIRIRVRSVCSIPGCDSYARGLGWCARHYARYSRHGDPLGVAERMQREVRFWSKVQVDAPEDCWMWTAGGTKSGYGYFWLTATKMAYAHRFAWEIMRHPIPDGMEIDHLCRVTSCVNPAHMEIVTPSENRKRAVRSRAS